MAALEEIVAWLRRTSVRRAFRRTLGQPPQTLRMAARTLVVAKPFCQQRQGKIVHHHAAAIAMIALIVATLARARAATGKEQSSQV